MIEKNGYLKNSNSISYFKIPGKLDDDRSGPFINDPLSLENSPKSNKHNKLEPLDANLLGKKLAEPKATVIRHYKAPTGALTPGPISSTAKTWNSIIDGGQTPSGSKTVSSKKSKFANSLMGSIEQGKNLKDRSDVTAFLTPKTNVQEENIFSGGSLTPEERDKTRTLTLEKLAPGRNLSVPTYKSPKRKLVEKSVVSKSKLDEMNPPESENSSPVKLNSSTDPYASIPYRHLAFGLKFDYENFKKHLLMMHKGLIYVTKNLKSPSDKFIKSKQVSLPETKKTKTLLLDLDETLIHSCLVRNKPDVVLSYQGSPNEPIRQLPIKIRPYLKEFLVRMSSVYEIVIFTASAMPYAKTIINYIDKDIKCISAILSRENCMETRNGFYIKDLRIIKDRELKNMVIVDNLVHSFGFQLENGVPILEFLDDKKDEELKNIGDYLMEAYNSDDMAEFNRERLRLREMADKRIEDIIR